MLLGLVVGLSVAAAIYINDRSTVREVDNAPATPSNTRPASDVDPEPAEPPVSRYSFYDMLPKFEVVIPEEEFAEQANSPTRITDKPGVFVLQAGSFSQHADADRAKAQLGLLGIVSRIQKVTIDKNVYYRVRIGPIDNLPELGETRGRLHQASIDFIVIRVAD